MINTNELAEKIYDSTSEKSIYENKKNDLRIIKEIIEPLMEIIKKAKAEKKYLYLSPCDRWFSPDELENGILEGYYIYTPDLWTLRNPLERIQELEREIEKKKVMLRSLREEVGHYLYGDKDKKLFMK